MPIFDPFNFLLLVTVFPMFIVGIILLEISLNIGFKFGLETFIQEFEKKWGAGLSLGKICKKKNFSFLSFSKKKKDIFIYNNLLL